MNVFWDSYCSISCSWASYCRRESLVLCIRHAASMKSKGCSHDQRLCQESSLKSRCGAVLRTLAVTFGSPDSYLERGNCTGLTLVLPCCCIWGPRLRCCAQFTQACILRWTISSAVTRNKMGSQKDTRNS